jgi:hypothetical protein
MQTLLINPSRRRRSKKRRASGKRRARRMSALQLKYFGKGRKRRAGGKRRRARVITVHANPRRRRRSAKRRSFRRNPSRALRLPSMSGTLGGLQRTAGTALQGAVGAVVTDVAMGQAAGFLPVNLTSRYNADGSINPAYYATKAALAFALGMVGAKVLPGRMKGYAAQGAVGAFTVMGYEVLRNILPPSITLGAYLNPARVVSGGMGRVGRVGRVGGRMGAYLTRQNVQGVRGFGASFGAGSAHPAGSADVRVGEGAIT